MYVLEGEGNGAADVHVAGPNCELLDGYGATLHLHWVRDFRTRKAVLRWRLENELFMF